MNVLKPYFKYSLLFLFFLCVKFGLFSQIDSTYITPYDNNLTVKVYTTSKFNTLLLRSMQGEKTIEPNTPLGLGLGVTWKKWGMSFSYGFGFMRNKKKGNTQSIDIQVNYCGRKVVWDIMGQLYQGFHEDNSRNGYHFYKDVSTMRFGVFGQYIFNSQKFSYSAAFHQKERQLRSAGSWLLGAGIYFNRIDLGDLDFLETASPASFKQSNFQLGPSGGYVHTWIMKKKFFITLSLSLGLNIGVNMEERDFMIAPSVVPRFAMGYNGEKWGLHVSYVNHLIYTLVSKAEKIGSSTGNIQLVFTKRFDIPSKGNERK